MLTARTTRSYHTQENGITRIGVSPIRSSKLNYLIDPDFSETGFLLEYDKFLRWQPRKQLSIKRNI